MNKKDQNILLHGECPWCKNHGEFGLITPIDDNIFIVTSKQYIRVVYECDTCESRYEIQYQSVGMVEL